jgi:putative inorganic carbon (HCO3(-)) transporter
MDAVFMFYLVAHGLSSDEGERLLRWLCVGSLLMGLLGIVQILGHINYAPTPDIHDVPPVFSHLPQRLIHILSLRNGRAVGPRGHPLTYAEGLIPAFFIFLLGLTAQKSDQKMFFKKGWAAVGWVLVSAGIVLSQARGVWLGLLGGLLVMGAMAFRKSPLKRLLLILLIAAPLVVAVSPRIRSRLFSIFSSSQGTVSDQQSKNTRLEIWRQAWTSMKEHPITGRGLEGARFNIVQPWTNIKSVWTEAHNIYLQCGVEMGWVGLALFIWIMILVGKTIIESSSSWRPAILASVVALWVAGLTESWMGDKEVAMIFWALVGFIHHSRKHEKKA